MPQNGMYAPPEDTKRQERTPCKLESTLPRTRRHGTARSSSGFLRLLAAKLADLALQVFHKVVNNPQLFDLLLQCGLKPRHLPLQAGVLTAQKPKAALVRVQVRVTGQLSFGSRLPGRAVWKRRHVRLGLLDQGVQLLALRPRRTNLAQSQQAR